MPSIGINKEILTFNNIYYTDSANGNDSYDGSKEMPFKTIQKAITTCPSGGAVVIKGTFTGATSGTGFISIDKNISLIGVLDGNGNIPTISTSDYNTIQLRANNIIVNIYRCSFYSGGNSGSGGDANYAGFCCLNSNSNVSLNIYNSYIEVASTVFVLVSRVASTSKVTFSNCVLKFPTLVANAGYRYCYGTNTVKYINCVDLLTYNSSSYGCSATFGYISYSRYGNNCSGFTKDANSISGTVTVDSKYVITSSASNWKNKGTGLNPDGSVAHLGMYGGIYALGIWIFDLYLIKDGSEIKVYQNGSWISTGLFEPLAKSAFETYGMSIMPTDLIALSDNFEVLTWTNSIETKKIQLTVDPFWLLEQLQNPELLIWTDDINMSSPMVSVTGKFKDIFRYKVEFEDTILKDWTEFTDQPVSDSVTVPSSIIQSLNPYTITVTAEQADGTIVTSSGTVTLYDTEPTLIVEMVGLDVHVQVGDAEGDDVQFLVRLNGTQLYPTEEGFTDLIPSPANWYKTLLSNEVNIGSDNIIEVTAKDQWGKQSSIIYNFVGEYAGIMFVECKEDDSEGDLYTTDLGELLKYLDFGILIAGQVSESIPVYLKNMTGKTITNIKFTSSNITLDSGVKVYIGDSNDVYGIEPTTITFTDVVQPEEKIKFHVRLHAYPTAKNPGVFEVLAIADTQ